MCLNRTLRIVINHWSVNKYAKGMVFRPLVCSKKLLHVYQQRLLTRSTCLQRQYSTHIDTSFKNSLRDYAVTRDISALVEKLPLYGIQSEVAPLYNAALSKCVSKGEMDHIEQITNLMKKRGVRMDTATYNILVRLKISRQTVKEEELFEAYRDIFSHSIKPNIATFNTFIKYACLRQYWNTVPHWLKMMKDQGILPNKITAQTIFRSLVNEPENATLLSALDFVTSNASLNAEFILNAGIVALIKEKKMTLASELLNTLFENDEPKSAYSYNIMITALCRQGQLSTANNVLDAMIHNSKIPNPDVITFTSLIHGTIKCGGDEKEQLDSIVRLYTKLLDYGLRPNNVLNSVMLSYFVKSPRYQKPEDLELFSEALINNKNQKDTQRQHGDTELIEMQVYNMMIDFYFSKSRNLTQLPKNPFLLLQHAVEKRKLQPTTATLNIFVRGLTDYHQDLNAAEKVLQFLSSWGVEANERTIWFLVKAALKQNQRERAQHWIQEFEKKQRIEGDGLLWLKSEIMKWSEQEKTTV